MIQNDCEKALVNLLKTSDVFLTKTDQKNMNVWSEPLKEFTKPSCGYWCEIKHIPAQPYQCELMKYGQNRWQGILQVNLCAYKDFETRHPEYATSVNEWVNYAYTNIAEVMKRGVILDRVHITGVGKSSAIDNGDYYSVPVSINWYATLVN